MVHPGCFSLCHGFCALAMSPTTSKGHSAPIVGIEVLGASSNQAELSGTVLCRACDFSDNVQCTV